MDKILCLIAGLMLGAYLREVIDNQIKLGLDKWSESVRISRLPARIRREIRRTK